MVHLLRDLHLHEGSGYIVKTEFDGQTWLRCTLMNPLTEWDDLAQMLEELEGLLPRAMATASLH